MTKWLLVLAGTVVVASVAGAEDDSWRVDSPDNAVKVEIVCDDEGVIAYSVDYRRSPVIDRAPLGLRLQGGVVLGEGAESVGARYREKDTTWYPVYGERSEVRDRFGELDLTFRNGASGMTWHLLVRAYDEGVALAYRIPDQDGVETIEIETDLTSFRFGADHPAWQARHAQGEYRKVPLSQIETGAERPMPIDLGQAGFAAIAEARLVDFARMKLASGDEAFTIRAHLDGPVRATTPLQTPWRVVMLGRTPGQLLEQNDLLLNLNDPCAIEDPSWIRPGKVLREVTLTTEGGKRAVDFAASHGLQYVEFDAGWYGHEYDDASDATTITVDPKRSAGPLDLQAVIDYGKARDIGIIVYVNRRALEKQLDEILPLYQSWGIAGVKYGFVNVGSQRWTTWLHEAVRLAADHQLMVDIHDEYRPTGYSRTYPNLMTQEGIRGDEASPSVEQTLNILFSRMLAGAGDHTICYYNRRVDKLWSHGLQLAKAVCFYSPWQFVYWYDRPPSSPDEAPKEGILGDEPELAFFAEVPAAWDDTKVLEGRIGEYAVIARRSGDRWFLGAMNAGPERRFTVSLDFLESGTAYRATQYRDDPEATTRTRVSVSDHEVRAGQPWTLPALPPNHGLAVRIEPATP